MFDIEQETEKLCKELGVKTDSDAGVIDKMIIGNALRNAMDAGGIREIERRRKERNVVTGEE